MAKLSDKKTTKLTCKNCLDEYKLKIETFSGSWPGSSVIFTTACDCADHMVALGRELEQDLIKLLLKREGL